MNNIFGTDGIRNTVGQGPFTVDALLQLGNAIGIWAVARYGNQARIVIGHDTRQSCSLVKTVLQTGLLLQGLRIFDASVVPTPVICHIVKYTDHFDVGIIISASHNPYQDNGIKIVTAQQGKINTHDEITISALFNQPLSYNYATLGTTSTIDTIVPCYTDLIKQRIPNPFLYNKKIVLDCAHGATSTIATTIFQYYGAQVITINNEPNGTNINDQCGTLYPQKLQQAVIDHTADIGFAFDGDGDRVIAINAQGVIKDGDDILCLLLQHPLYKDQTSIVGTIMTNQGFAHYLKNNNRQLIRTPVGDKYVSEKLESEKLLIGGEQSGHIILRDYMESGDGIFTALRLLQVLDYTNNWCMNTFTKFPQVLINIPILRKEDLSRDPFAQLIAGHEKQLNNGRLIVRYSGTESLLRIMVEDSDQNHAYYIGKELSEKLAHHLS